MSEDIVSQGAQRAWRFYLDDMIGFAENVLAYTGGHELKTFLATQITYDATLRNLELIGEAATHIPAEVRERAPQIPWRQIIATRNRLIHGYLGIDDEVLWSIIEDDIPSLLVNLRVLRTEVDDNRNP